MKQTFKSYLQESRSGTGLTVAEAANLIFEHYMQAFENPTLLWRGSSNYPHNAKAVMVEPGKYERISTTDHNIVNLVTSNVDSWDRFPARNKSLIGATARYLAAAYDSHNIWRVLPINDSRIGVCPKSDFWNSFEKAQVEFDIHEVQDLEAIINKLHEKATGESLQKIESFYDLRQVCNEIDQSIKSRGVNYFKIASESGATLEKSFLNDSYNLVVNKIKDGKLLDFLDDVLNPRHNGFTLTNIATLKGSSKEFWTSDQCLLIKGTAWDEIEAAVHKVMTQ